MNNKTAFAYLRVSSRGQIGGHGFDRQAEAIAQYARRAGVKIVGTYRDAHTGTEADRPAFVEMLAAIIGNGVRTIIVESLDRFARDLMVQTALLGQLQKHGVALVCANTGEDVTAGLADDPMREALVTIQGVFSQLDKRLLVRKLRLAREAKRKADGRCEGRKPFGGTEKAPIPAERAALARIRILRRRRAGRKMSFASIAETLNAEKVSTRHGGPWAASTIGGVCGWSEKRLLRRRRATAAAIRAAA